MSSEFYFVKKDDLNKDVNIGKVLPCEVIIPSDKPFIRIVTKNLNPLIVDLQQYYKDMDLPKEARMFPDSFIEEHFLTHAQVKVGNELIICKETELFKQVDKKLKAKLHNSFVVSKFPQIVWKDIVVKEVSVNPMVLVSNEKGVQSLVSHTQYKSLGYSYTKIRDLESPVLVEFFEMGYTHKQYIDASEIYYEYTLKNGHGDTVKFKGQPKLSELI